MKKEGGTRCDKVEEGQLRRGFVLKIEIDLLEFVISSHRRVDDCDEKKITKSQRSQLRKNKQLGIRAFAMD